MTAVTTLTGALSTGPGAWHTIHWYAVHRTVRRLQARIVKAVQAGRWGKVRALQHLLTHSSAAKPLPCNGDDQRWQEDPGVDGCVWIPRRRKHAPSENCGSEAIALARSGASLISEE